MLVEIADCAFGALRQKRKNPIGGTIKILGPLLEDFAAKDSASSGGGLLVGALDLVYDKAVSIPTVEGKDLANFVGVLYNEDLISSQTVLHWHASVNTEADRRKKFFDSDQMKKLVDACGDDSDDSGSDSD